MLLVDLIIIAMGTWGLTELLRHDHRLVTILERWETLNKYPWTRTVWKCGFCLSHWAAIASLLLYYAVPLGFTVVMMLGATRIANCLNDVFHRFSRTPPGADLGLKNDTT